MSEQLYKTVGEKLISEKEGRKQDPLYLRLQEERKLSEVFGVSNTRYGQWILNKWKSRFFTEEEIAQVLLDNDLVKDKKEGLTETKNLLRYGIGKALWKKYDRMWEFCEVVDKGERKLQLTHARKTYERYE